ncbi:MAG TPA: hypothetical protein VER11_34525 [Polyangiaceae bacterium]|nr:hypothetical protein [Polyangiaceae bacterium]
MSGALREILAIFGTEVDDSGLKKGEAGVESFKKTLGEMGEALVGAFAIHKIVDFTKEVLESADVLAKQAQSLNVATSDLQGWQWAAKLSGSSAEEFTGAFTKFNRNLAEASKGAGPAADALKLFGVTAQDVKNKSPSEALELVADGFGKVEDPAKRTAAAMALFGKSGNRLAPLLLEGADGVRKLRAEVDELGNSFDDAFLADAQEVNDNVDRLTSGFRGLAIQAIKPLLPTLTEMSKKSVELIKWLIEIERHSEAVKAGLLVFGAVGAAKAISAMVALAQKAGFLKSGLRGLLLELAPLVLGFLAIEDVWTFLTGGKSVTGDLITKFFGPDAVAKVQAFAKALSEDFGPVVSEVLSIFTNGKPLDEKLKQLNDYINGTLKPQFKADFGEMADSMLAIVAAAGDIAVAIDKVAKVLKWVIGAVEWVGQNAVINPIGKLLFSASDTVANDAARGDAALRGNPGRRAAAEDYDQPWYLKAIGALTGIDSQQVADAANSGIKQKAGKAAEALSSNLSDASYLLAPSVATAPVISSDKAPEINQSVRTEIKQNFYVDTPEEIQKAASEGAKQGVQKGSDLLATQAAVSKKGG